MKAWRGDELERSPEELAAAAGAIVAQCKPIFAGQHPVAQGAAIADLIALWLGGHRPDVREPAFNLLIELARKSAADTPGGRLWARMEDEHEH